MFTREPEGLLQGLRGAKSIVEEAYCSSEKEEDPYPKGQNYETRTCGRPHPKLFGGSVTHNSSPEAHSPMCFQLKPIRAKSAQFACNDIAGSILHLRDSFICTYVTDMLLAILIDQ
jgi:hypothetical protein